VKRKHAMRQVHVLNADSGVFIEAAVRLSEGEYYIIIYGVYYYS